MADNEQDRDAAEETPEQVEESGQTVAEAAQDATGAARDPEEEKRRRWAQRQVQNAFAACVRCGYFLSDYRLLHGDEHFGDVVGTSGRGWLELTWAPRLRRLLEKSYGLRIDSDVDHFKGSCSTCGRAFVLQRRDEAEDETADMAMRMQIRPRGRANARS